MKLSDEHRNRLHQLMSMHDLCVKMGGTKGYERITPIVERELKNTLDEIEKGADYESRA